jgi:hypothetical protein
VKRLQRLFLLIFFFACTSALAKTGTYVLKYEEFGPPVIASDVIGMDWWQWQPHGDSRPRHYEIKVVVYRGLALDRVKVRYPVVPEKNKDYRYIEYVAALAYLDEKIGDDVMEPVTSTLKSTRQKIVRALGKK